MGLQTTICVLALVVGVALAQRRPPNYSLDEMPDIQTSFSCYDKIVGGYYSDPETDCQMFHVCVRVAGVGVQDFRFLCPNDTAFDQENQICDDWYNIDCEASTLFYSDNFDLFRLSQDNNFNPVKATPIPLGPSSAPRIAPHPPKPHRPHAPINNAVGESDDDLYLQRADAGDKRVSQDLLRGSSSSNFFSNRNKGKEDPDDDYVAPSVKEQELIKNKKKNKNQVRKLLTGKRPVTQAPTEAPTTTTTVFYNRYNTVQRNRPTTTTENYPTTAPPNNNNYNNQRFNNNNQQQPTPQDFQRFRGNQNFAFNKKPVVSTNAAPEVTTTAAPAFNNYNQNNNFRGTNYYQQSTAAPAYNQNFYSTKTQSSTAAPTNYKTNYNYQTSTTAAPTNYKTNYYQTPTTVAPQFNYNQQTSTPASTVYNAYQNRASQQPSTGFNNYQNNNYQPQNTNNFQAAYNSPSTVNANSNYDATTLKQNYYQKQTTANYDNYYKTSTNTPVVAYSTTFAPDTQKYYDSSANVYQQTKNQFNYNVNAAGPSTANYNPYNSYKGNDNYDEPSQGESLKTAPSSNIRPSDLNAIAKSYQKPAGGFNATLSAGYNFANPQTTQKPTSKFYSSPKQFQTTKSQTTVKPFQQNPTTYQPASRGNAYYAQSTTAASPQPRPFSKAPEGTVAPKPTVTKEKDASYDYAYYDEGTGSEYDGIDTIGEEFSRTTSHKGSRTTPQ
ncbi:GATA zinc finger domain-containing protein 14-like [Macrosteles quadrilineatus]|uniref:GATA zinc finger domain-containing protein 14-like n=1 Tax=Macrosteles quadrilineatus TaxID=74068 RepID=UPI0023E0F2FC|nr:GATA zinc finger domain-containing protein 14-like [Macrosteles quadrilineatus]